MWSDGAPRRLLLSLVAAGQAAGAETLERPVGAPARAWLTLHRPPGPGALPCEDALRSLSEAVAALEAHLDVLAPILPEDR